MVEFHPPRRSGMFFHLGALTVMAVLAIWGLWEASQASVVLLFIFYLVPVRVAIILIPMLVYRWLALRRAFYRLERDGVSLRWGLRYEDIPIDAIMWVRPVRDVESLRFPWLRWPGAFIGSRRLPNGSMVEFMAAETASLVLIATHRRVFAISPEDPGAFLRAYQRVTELGSLSPLPARSVFPTFLLARVWRNPPARYLLLGGLALNLILLAWVGLVAPVRPQILLGFQREGEAVPGIRLLLLPVLSNSFFLVDFFMGLFFYRREAIDLPAPVGVRTPPVELATSQVLAYLLWGSGILTPLLFMLAVFYILLV